MTVFYNIRQIVRKILVMKYNFNVGYSLNHIMMKGCLRITITALYQMQRTYDTAPISTL